MNQPLLTLLCTSLLTLGAHAKLVAWYPLDESPSAPDEVNENLENRIDAFTIGFDPDDPEFSFITRGHPSARQNLGTSYLIEKGGGLELGDDESVQPTDKFTISFWFQPLTLDAFDRFIETQVTNTNAQDGIRIDMGSGNKVRVLIRDNNGATNTQFSHPITLKNDGTWYFFAFRYDSEDIDNAPFQITVVEVTGDPVDETVIADATAGPATISTGPIHYPHANDTLIGVENSGGTGGNSINAAMDELAFYDNSDGNGVLSNAQLADVYNFGPSGEEVVKEFATDAASISPGNPATLSWSLDEGFDTVVLDDGLGNVTDLAPMTTNGAGTIAVTPDATTTYTLKATKGTSANVLTLRILAGAAPDIDSFGATAEVIKGGDSLELNWMVTGADTVTIDPGAADVTEMNSISAAPTATTTYTLSATNAFGTAMASVTVTVISGPVPVHRYVATQAGNDDIVWVDGVGNKNLNINGAFPDDLLTPSANTNLTKSYFTGGGLAGGSTGAFQFPEFTIEIWLRPSEDLGADHEVIFETGGGQNGLAILMTQSGFRFIGSSGDERNLDLEVTKGNLVFDDFLQLVLSTHAADDTIEIAIRDTFGNVRTASETADVILGGNGATLFAYGSGGLGGDNNLGGRTEADDVNPEGLTGFSGEIAVVNVYDRILGASDIELAFNEVATDVGTPPPAFAITELVRDANTLTVTWDSLDGSTYGAQFSTDLIDWFDLAGPFPGTGSSTTETLNVPPNQAQFFVRIGQQQ